MMSEAEDVSYLIEKEIIFTPSTQCMMRVDRSQELKLKPTASQCLFLLIKNHGQIVTQNELLEFAWGDQHRQASFNAFYQSILSLRKSFLHLKVEKAIITTLPRKGLVIQNDIDIEKIDTPFREKEFTPLLPEPVFTEQECPSSPVKRRWMTPAEIIIIVLTLVAVSMLLYPRWSQNDYFSRYVAAKNMSENCHYYFNSDASDFSRHTYFVKQHPNICSEGKYLYLTAYPETKNLSVITCNLPIHAPQENNCQSVYYPRYNSQ